ncbi:MAG TPA: GMC family oxidoreductase [Candidatus Binatia bacterium]|nr:GMC family oxidoreductase [Candidatus Binatia bacterium]
MLTFNAGVLDAEFDACVVGAGPAGIACALDLRARGLKVLMLEAGRERPVPGNPDLLAADLSHAEHHDPTDIVAAHALGGSSHWWGGRSVPFDPADFAHWPLSYAEMLPWYDRAAEFLGAHAVHETPAPGAFANLSDFDATRDETWCPQINMSIRWRNALRADDGPSVLLGARVVGMNHAGGRVESLRVRVGADERAARAKRFILTCGGLGGLKLLLLAQRETPHLFGGQTGSLGRGYMGHLTGAIADIELAHPHDVDAFSTRSVAGGVRARRRIRPRAETIAREHLVNVAFWLENASNENAEHGSAVASAKFVAARALRAMAGRGGENAPLKPHLDNIASAPVSAAVGVARAGYLLAMTRLTGQLPRPPLTVPSGKGTWRLDYHAEQRPDPANRISLSPTRTDSVGHPALKVDFRFSDQDIEAVMIGHELLDADLQRAGAGRLRMRGDRAKSLQTIKAFARDGYHQLGGAVMNPDAARGVVDTSCRAHGIENLYVISGSVFPSGSQANPTLTIVALSRRLAAHLVEA